MRSVLGILLAASSVVSGIALPVDDMPMNILNTTAFGNKELYPPISESQFFSKFSPASTK
jgi:hypothetical protein